MTDNIQIFESMYMVLIRRSMKDLLELKETALESFIVGCFVYRPHLDSESEDVIFENDEDSSRPSGSSEADFSTSSEDNKMHKLPPKHTKEEQIHTQFMYIQVGQVIWVCCTMFSDIDCSATSMEGDFSIILSCGLLVQLKRCFLYSHII